MRFAAEIDLEPKVVDNIEDLYLKRRELEDRMRSIDWLHKLRSERGALIEIEAYRADRLRSDNK
jgi:hypothetical protein